jgi:uracil-DNA glycosylase family 4
VALGKFAAQALLRTLDPISRLRGRVYAYRGAKLIPTFHPAYLLRNPASKREVWEDMKLVKRLLTSDV